MKIRSWPKKLASPALGIAIAAAAATQASATAATGLSAEAATLAADVMMYTGDADRPRFVVFNRSAPDVKITGFDLSVGDTQFNFDFVGVLDIAAGAEFEIVSSTPDMDDSGGERSDIASLEFLGFGGGSIASIATELDEDTGDAFVSFSSILFDNGAAPNAELTLHFAQGDDTASITKTLADGFLLAEAANPGIEIRGEFGTTGGGTELSVANVVVPAKPKRAPQLIDGSIADTSFWTTSGDTWFELELVEAAAISGLELAPRPNRGYAVDVFIDGMHAGSFTLQATPTVELQRLDLPLPITGSTVRVEVTNNNWIRFHEAKVLGE